MANSFRTTRKADQDIIDLYGLGLREFGTIQADRYQSGLINTFDLLAANPRMSRERTEFSPPVRLHPYQSHLIIYIEHEEGMLIIPILHARQDWERYLS